jgi:hypothetical protein
VVWPTPRAEERNQYNSRPGDNYVALSLAVKQWPTPQTHDVAKGDAKRVGRYGTKHGGRNLNDEVVMWQTPSAVNIGARSPEAVAKRLEFRKSIGRKTAPPGGLAEQVQYDHPITDMTKAERISGQLNADWVSLLMGFSKDWTVVDGSAESPER